MTFLKDFFNFIQKEASLDQGGSEIRLKTTVVDDVATCYAHVMNRNSETFDFCLTKIGDEVVMHSNPYVQKAGAGCPEHPSSFCSCGQMGGDK